MFLRQCFRNKDGKRHAYWALVESYRTDAGPRQRVVAWLGKLDEAERLGVEQAARDASSSHAKESTAASDEQLSLFNKRDDQELVQPQWIEVNASDVRVENCRQFGGPWLALEIVRKLQLDEFLKGVMLRGREQVSWWRSALILVVARLCRPSSELYVAEQWYPKSSLPGLLGVPADRVDDNRLYRTLDQLLPHQAKLEAHLKNRLGELFDLEYDLLMYDITSTYFEGQANFEMAQRGYSRDGRGDCKQVCIGLVVSRCGMPLGYEVFAGNTADVTTVQQIVTTMAEAAFRIHKSDLKIRPIWHQKEERVLAHIFVCFLAYVLWKTLGQMCEQAGLGSEPRRVLDELSELRMMDVILPTRSGIEIRKRCLSKPTDHQQILLDRLQPRLPKINQTEM